jgi:hypothetical protein
VAYRADIEIAVKGAQELKRLQNEIRVASDAVDSLNSNLSGIANLVPRSFDNLSKTVAQAAKSFNAAALETDEAATAARKYVQATDALNAGLRERISLLAKIRAEERITKPGDAGTGQQTPALPPQLIRTYEIGKNWVKFFQDAAGVAVDLQARALNTKASWNDFFATAAQAAVNVKANSLNTQKNWNDFFATAAQAAVNVKANSLNTKASWNAFFIEAAQLADDLTARTRQIEGSASAAARNRLAADQEARRTAAPEVSRRLISGVAAPQGMAPGNAPVSTAMQGPLAGPGAMGFPVALALSKVEQAGLETAAKKQEILQRMVATKQALAGLAANLQRLDLNSSVAIADAVRSQAQLNAAKTRQLQITEQIRASEGAASNAARQRLAQETARRNKMQNAGFGVQGPKAPPSFLQKLSNPSSKLGSAVIGGGFPALMGGGPGTIAGGAIGGLLGGFAGSIGGSAIGQFIDQAVAGVQKLGNAFVLAAGSYSAIREQGVVFTAELEKQVRLAKQQGDFAKARELASGSLAGQTGDIGGVGVQGVTAGVNGLQAAWNGVTKAVSLTLGIIASPFIAALALVLRAVQSIFMLVNAIFTGIAAVINLIPGAKQLGDAIAEQAQKGTAEYENQLAELDKQIATGQKLLQIETAKNKIVASSFGKSKEELAIAQKEADAKERILKFEQAQDALEADAPIGTAELRKKLAVQLAIQSRTFIKQEQTLALTNATELANKIKDYNREVAETKRQYEQQYQDAVREASRAQADDDLAAIRRLQDARIKMREQDLAYIKRVQDEEIKAAQLVNKQRSLTGGVNAALSGDPNAELLNTVQTAVDEYRTGRLAVEQDAAAEQKKIQVQLQKTDLAILRAKIDNARRVARLNEDSQIKIARINETINKQNEAASRRKFEAEKSAQLAALNVLKLRETVEGIRAQQFGADPNVSEKDKAFYKLVEDTAVLNINEIESTRQKLVELFASVPVNKLLGMAALPARTDTTGDASAAESAAAEQLATYEKQIVNLKRINALKQEDIALAEQILSPSGELLTQLNNITQEQTKLVQGKQTYSNLINTGVLPGLAAELQTIEAARNTATATVDALISKLSELAKDPLVKKFLEDEAVFGKGGALGQLGVIRGTVQTKAAAAVQGAEAAASPLSRTREEITKVQGELNTLLDPVNQVTKAAESIGTAFSDSFKGVISGSMSAREALASFFTSVADMFLDMAAQIIAKMITMAILNQILGVLPGIGGAGSGTLALSSNPNVGAYMGGGGIEGITMGTFGGTRAKGGPVSSGQTYMVGERGPELFVPGRSGSIVPNGAMGGDVNVVVNVDAKGSSVEGDQSQAKALGNAISAAVQSELVKQKRPGGLLA